MKNEKQLLFKSRLRILLFKTLENYCCAFESFPLRLLHYLLLFNLLYYSDIYSEIHESSRHAF